MSYNCYIEGVECGSVCVCVGVESQAWGRAPVVLYKQPIFWTLHKLCRQVSCGLHMEKAILGQAPCMADRSEMAPSPLRAQKKVIMVPLALDLWCLGRMLWGSTPFTLPCVKASIIWGLAKIQRSEVGGLIQRPGDAPSLFS